MSPNDPILYSNRSLAFLKLDQLYYANEDSDKAIELDPNWAKGYFRKAEVLFAAGQYDSALLSYAAALQRQPNDLSILDAAKKSAAFSNRDKMLDNRVPWVGAGIGIILGVLIVILDQVATKQPTVGVSCKKGWVIFSKGHCFQKFSKGKSEKTSNNTITGICYPLQKRATERDQQPNLVSV